MAIITKHDIDLEVDNELEERELIDRLALLDTALVLEQADFSRLSRNPIDWVSPEGEVYPDVEWEDQIDFSLSQMQGLQSEIDTVIDRLALL